MTTTQLILLALKAFAPLALGLILTVLAVRKYK
jgi:hypothetical protein